MDVVALDVNRTEYTMARAAGRSITVDEFINILRRYPGEAPVVFRNDGGYTFGYICEDFVECEWADEDD